MYACVCGCGCGCRCRCGCGVSVHIHVHASTHKHARASANTRIRMPRAHAQHLQQRGGGRRRECAGLSAIHSVWLVAIGFYGCVCVCMCVCVCVYRRHLRMCGTNVSMLSLYWVSIRSLYACIRLCWVSVWSLCACIRFWWVSIRSLLRLYSILFAFAVDFLDTCFRTRQV